MGGRLPERGGEVFIPMRVVLIGRLGPDTDESGEARGLRSNAAVQVCG
jgi:hypothetical protein